MAAYGEGLVRPRRRRKEKRGHGKEEEEEEDKESLIAAADATLGQDKRTTVPLITHGMQGTILFSFSFFFLFYFFFFFALVLEEDTRSSDAIEVLLLLVSLDSFKRKEVFLKKKKISNLIFLLLFFLARTSTQLLRGSSECVPPARYPEWLAQGSVRKFRVSGGSHGEEEKAAKVARGNEPVVLASCPFAAKLVSRWSFKYFSRAFHGAEEREVRGGEGEGGGGGGGGDTFPKGKEEEEEGAAGAGEEGRESTARFEVLCSMDGRNRFMDLDRGKNVYGSYYHVREPETIVLEDIKGFEDFEDCARNWNKKHVCLRKPLMRRRVKEGLKENYVAAMTPETMPEILIHSSSRRSGPMNEPPCVKRDLMTCLDWSWMFSFLRGQNFGSIKDVILLCGTRNGLHPSKYEDVDQLIVQVKGRTRLLLIAPQHSFTGLYPYPIHHPYDKYSMVDFEAEDEENKELWPSFGEGARGVECILEPGEVLYVPQYFFVQRHDLDEEVVALRVNVSQGRRIRSEDAVPLQISRLLEERVSELESVREAHHWLSIIAYGEESEWIDTSTVRGHRRIKFVESVYEEVESNLGKGNLPSFLKAVVDRRLMPTPWLNKKEFREPLYLLDKPFTLQDDRSSLEKKFPELFRSKLKRDGWQVPEVKSTVPIPGYNIPANADYRTYGQENH